MPVLAGPDTMQAKTMTRRSALTASGAVLLAGCSRSTEPKQSAEAEPPKPARPQTFKVRFETSKGPFVAEVHRDWAPLGVARFEELVKDGFYDGARFFRVVPNFVIQFGIAADPRMTKKWNKPIKDDEPLRTNGYGTMAFATAGPETRTTQVFINLRSNQVLDKQGFAPFATVTEGMEVVEKLYAGYGERPDQPQIERRGNAYLNSAFPNLDYIKTARIL
jgi:peptidyl-prolyl cis-trans isomerase A (cyclophilin A)